MIGKAQFFEVKYNQRKYTIFDTIFSSANFKENDFSGKQNFEAIFWGLSFEIHRMKCMGFQVLKLLKKF